MSESTASKSSKKKEKKKPVENPLLKSLPPSIEKLSERIGLRKVPEGYIREFIRHNIPQNTTYTLNEYKEYIFSNDKFKKRKRQLLEKKRKCFLNASEQRRLAVFKLDPATTKFITFIPVHELWKQYMQKMLQLKQIDSLPEDLSFIYQKLLKADYHGCMLVVVSSVCHTYIGIRGIVVQETKNVFRLITQEDKLKTIPKKGSVFCFELNGNIFKIYGDNFCFVPYERIRVKYKIRQLVDP